ncbi:MAG TPA: type IV pilus assembly protein PilM [Nitrospirales bacterium]|nr:type IV pilus assembly protein PilM [Nitrospirales bacterium]
MGLFSKEKLVVGLDIGSHAIKLVELSLHKDKYRIDKLGIAPLPPGAVVDGAIMEHAQVVDVIKELFKSKKVKTKNVAISLSGPSVVVKVLHVPLMTEEELEEQVTLEAEQYVPFDLDEVNLDFHILRDDVVDAEGEAMMAVLLVAAKLDILEARTAVVKDAGLNPVVMDVDVFAIENMYEINYDVSPEEITALVNVGASYVNINILADGGSAFTRDVLIGGNRYIEALKQELSLSDEDAVAMMKGIPVDAVQPGAADMILESVNDEVTTEVTRSFDFFRSAMVGYAMVGEEMEEIKKVVLSGGGAQIAGLAQMLSNQLGIEVEFADPFRQMDLADKDYTPEALAELAPLAAIGVGLATRMVGDR